MRLSTKQKRHLVGGNQMAFLYYDFILSWFQKAEDYKTVKKRQFLWWRRNTLLLAKQSMV